MECSVECAQDETPMLAWLGSPNLHASKFSFCSSEAVVYAGSNGGSKSQEAQKICSSRYSLYGGAAAAISRTDYLTHLVAD